MPPKAAASESAATMESPAKPAASSKVEEDFKLAWGIICQMAKQGKLSGIDWDQVKEQIGANTTKTTQNRYYALRDRMEQAGHGLPKAEAKEGPGSKVAAPKTPKTPKKRKDGEECVAEGDGPAATPEGCGGGAAAEATPVKKQKKAKAEGDSAKKTPKKTAKQLKVEKEAASEETAEDDVDGPNGSSAHIKAEMEVDS